MVDTNDTASKLLKNGRLTRRITFLPLNKIQGNVINDATLKAARSCVPNGHNLVHRAIDLIEYSNEFELHEIVTYFVCWCFGYRILEYAIFWNPPWYRFLFCLSSQ